MDIQRRVLRIVPDRIAELAKDAGISTGPPRGNDDAGRLAVSKRPWLGDSLR